MRGVVPPSWEEWEEERKEWVEDSLRGPVIPDPLLSISIGSQLKPLSGFIERTGDPRSSSFNFNRKPLEILIRIHLEDR